MIHAFECRVTLEFGSHRRVVDVVELARAIGVQGQEARLRAVLVAAMYPQPVHTPSGEREPKERIGQSFSALNENERGNMSSSFPFRGEGGVQGNHRGSEHERLAVYLADRLDDWKSYRFFLATARRVPRDVILNALTRALDIPRQDVRRSRAAYFTCLVRSFLCSRGMPLSTSPTHYAKPSPSA